jgi:hypothetical protein
VERRAAAADAGACEAARYQALHRGCYLRHWVDPDAAARLSVRGTVAVMAPVLGAIHPVEAEVVRSRAEGRRKAY